MNTAIKQKRNGRQNEITEAAIKLFLSKGVGDTSIRDIASSLGISVGALYHYYKSKQEIIDGVAVKSARDLSSLQDYYMSLGKVKPAVALKQCIIFYLTSVDDRKMPCLFIEREFRSFSPKIQDSLNNIGNDFLRFFEHLIAEGIRQGEFNVKYRILAATLIFAVAYQWVSDRWRYQDNANIDDYAKDMASLIVGSILVDNRSVEI